MTADPIAEVAPILSHCGAMESATQDRDHRRRGHAIRTCQHCRTGVAAAGDRGRILFKLIRQGEGLEGWILAAT
ncbi:MAG: hypothetical protein R3D05_12860 [Dongiaceae bacterium]